MNNLLRKTKRIVAQSQMRLFDRESSFREGHKHDLYVRQEGVLPYTLISLVFVFLGTMMSSDLVWELTDTANYLMVLPNIIGLVAGTALTVKLLKEGKETAAKK